MSRQKQLGVAPFLYFVACWALLAACGGRAYVYQPIEDTDVRGRAEVQSDEFVRVSAAVPGEEEAAMIFGVPLYDAGVQPVWLEVENRGSEQIRYAPTGTDRFYFSPLEIAYKHRGGFSEEARSAMEKRLRGLAMPRYVDPGETRSGFVFTHQRAGAKAFNVDLFGPGRSSHFTFLLSVPGFVPDYANLDLDAIYPAEDVVALNENGLRDSLAEIACCSTDANGTETASAINVVLIGSDEDLMHALFRGDWMETSAAQSATDKAYFLSGRRQDATFRYRGIGDDNFYELRLWYAPFMVGTQNVWLGQARYHISARSRLAKPDPDVDNARDFLLQNLWYAQTLRKLGWLSGGKAVPLEAIWTSGVPSRYFTDGYRIVLWVSHEPVSLLDTISVDWDWPPGGTP